MTFRRGYGKNYCSHLADICTKILPKAEGKWLAVAKCTHGEAPKGAGFCPKCGEMINLAGVLYPRVPERRWPQPRSECKLADCGPTGRMVENKYAEQQHSWPLYEQSGHAGSCVLIAESGNERRVCLVRQWRPVDIDCVELPAGNIGVKSPQEMIEKLMAELREEVGEVEIASAFTAPGFSHDVGREIAAGGGPKCFFPFVIHIKAEVPPKTHNGEGDEKTHSQWYTYREVQEMIREEKVSDMVTIFFLVCAGIVDVEDLGWRRITHLII